MGVFLFTHICLTDGFVSYATDYAAEEEARRSLPIASNSYEEWPDGPAVGAAGAILMEAETGTILYEKNIHEHLYPASVTKILTCLIAIENCQMDETVEMSHEAVFSIPRDSSNIGMDEGEKITVEQCLYGILVGSANEVSNAIAEHVSGNIEDFCNKWGAEYDFMIILDADSLMTGKTILRMVQLMEANPGAGIIQAPPMMINSHSLFARIQQFAGRVYGPIVSAGLAYWQLGDSNYWGHNAIIRVKAFIDCCGLPVLPGKAPFGGHILSHDFVEAALIRRGGWSAWLLPELKGSYEECPPTMIDFAARDRRWCQGNLQHIKILLSRHLHPVSRVHFTIGIMSYLSSPIWLCFLIVGLAIALGRGIFPPTYFTEARTLFPTWPIFDKIGTIALFVISMFMLVFPKFLGLIVYKCQNKGTCGTLKSTLVEIVLSALMAPIMMMFQSKFVWDILTGHSVNWNTQNRGDAGTSFKDAFSRHFWHTLLGIATTVIVALYAKELFWWMLPITIGLILSIPISMLTSKVASGQWTKRHNYFLIPEESKVPDILQSAKEYENILKALEPKEKGISLLLKDQILNNLHVIMLPVNGPAPDISPKDFEAAQIKLENHINHKVELDLSKEEEIALLYHPEVLQQAAISQRLFQSNQI